jgi:chromate transport protein ChrA
MNEASVSVVASTAAKHLVSLKTLALVFLKLGTIAFGGPAAHIAMMEDEFVTRRQWLTREQFLDRRAAANVIPGPSSTEMAIFVGSAYGTYLLCWHPTQSHSQKSGSSIP